MNTMVLINMIKKSILLQFLLMHSVFSDHSENSPTWFYPADGVERWTGSCKGKRQSPIDIKDFDIEQEKSTTFQLLNYEKAIVAEAENNGHTVQMNVNSADNLHIVGGGIRGKYQLKQIHFHWESEHTLDGKRYPLEVHFVHVSNTRRHRRHSNTVDDNDIHVLSGLYYVNKNNNTELNTFFKSLMSVSHLGEKSKMEIVPRYLLPKDVDEFFRYEGSLTVPSCSENVEWTVFYSKVPISNQQYEIIRGMETVNGSFSTNYRRTQPLNDRRLKLLYIHSSSRKLYESFNVLIALVFILIMFNILHFENFR
ncbi:putative carbonic anhydrase 3 [Arctopsyche grandis]|uniref:putative carbonic anhydrase 3 n=1 Tax=Arctopsyche grandis TaxID=121162 RepID=UPI00406D8D3B